MQRTKQSNIQSYMYSCLQGNIENRNLKKLQKNKETRNQTYKFTNIFKRHKGHLIRLQVFKLSNTQTIKSPNVQTKKIKSKLERNNEFQVIKYITNSKTKQPKTL